MTTKFEIVLKNGAALATDSAEELCNFFESDGCSITEVKPKPKKRHFGKKRVKK